MLRAILTRGRGLALAAAVVLTAGCGDSGGTVTGEVTYDGQPVAKGYVTFSPADGKGPTAGGEIVNGRYTAEKVPVGPKVVKVEASAGPGPSVQSAGEVEKLSKDVKGKLGKDGIIRTETVPADAEGNNRKYDVTAGPQTLDLKLTKGAEKKR